jgi:hypothetical protein
VVQSGNRVLLDGAADASLIGHKVAIIFNRKRVASATVGSDGLFTTTAPLPPKRIRNSNRARYVAESGGLRSLNLKLTRRLIFSLPTSSGGKVTLAGEVVRPLAKPLVSIAVQQMVSCTKAITVAHLKPAKNGRFSFTINAPANKQAVAYRLRTQVRKNTRSRKLFATFSLPEAVTLH